MPMEKKVDEPVIPSIFLQSKVCWKGIYIYRKGKEMKVMEPRRRRLKKAAKEMTEV